MNELMDEWIEVASEKNWFNKKYILIFKAH